MEFKKAKTVIAGLPEVQAHEATYDQVYNKFWDILYKKFYFTTKHHHLAEDLAQEVMVDFWKKYKDGDRDYQTWHSLIATMANRIYASYQIKTIDKTVPLTSFANDEDTENAVSAFIEASPSDNLSDRPHHALTLVRVREIIGEAMAQLNESHQRLITDFYVDDIHHTDIMKKHGIEREDFFWVYIQRARDALVRELRRRGITNSDVLDRNNFSGDFNENTGSYSPRS